MSALRVVGAAALREGCVLMARRPEGRKHAGLWEFPGGKVEAGEDDAAALSRELLEELGVAARVGELLGVGQDGVVELFVYRVELLGEPEAREHAELAWLPLGELAALPLPPADVVPRDALLRRGV